MQSLKERMEKLLLIIHGCQEEMGGPYDTKIRVITNSGEKVEEFKGPEHLFFFEAELASQTILKQRTEVPYPGMTWDDSLGNIKVLDMWRKEIGYYLEEDN